LQKSPIWLGAKIRFGYIVAYDLRRRETDFGNQGAVMNLSRYRGKRIALVMDVQGREVVLHGTTDLRLDAKHGHVLKVTVADDDRALPGHPVFYITEQRWRDRISSGETRGCDYCLDLSTATTVGACP
jgi:hypothetical protein